jgi:hypothetical protein
MVFIEKIIKCVIVIGFVCIKRIRDDLMNTLFEFCIYRLKPSPLQPQTETTATSPVQQPKKCCANFCCNEFEEDNMEWITCIHNKRHHRFCSIACQNEWLDNPSMIGCYSPPQIEPKDEANTELPILQLDT